MPFIHSAYTFLFVSSQSILDTAEELTVVKTEKSLKVRFEIGLTMFVEEHFVEDCLMLSNPYVHLANSSS